MKMLSIQFLYTSFYNYKDLFKDFRTTISIVFTLNAEKSLYLSLGAILLGKLWGCYGIIVERFIIYFGIIFGTLSFPTLFKRPSAILWISLFLVGCLL